MNQYSSRRRNTATRHSGKTSSGDHIQFLLFYILPFIVINIILFLLVTGRPRYVVTIHDTTDYLSAEVSLHITSWLPTKEVTMSMDAVPFELAKGRNRTYTAIVPHNGVVEANVVNFNGMSTLQFEHVDILDDIPPVLEDAEINDGIVSMMLSDSQSGIDYSSILATDTLGTPIQPLTLSKETGAISFEMGDTGLIVLVSDMAGNEVQGSFSSHLEGEEEILTENYSGTSVGDESAETEVTIQSTLPAAESSSANDAGEIPESTPESTAATPILQID